MSRKIRVVLLVGGLVVIALLVAKAGPALVVDMLARVGWSFLAVVAIHAVYVVLRTVALWRSVTRHSVQFLDVLRIRLSAEAVEVLTFTGPFLAEPAKGWWLTRRGLPSADSFAAVATEYLLYTTVSAGMALSALLLLTARGTVPNMLQPATFALSAVSVAFIAGVVFAALSGIGLIAPAVRASRIFVGKSRAALAAHRIDPVEQVLVAFLHRNPERLTEVLATEMAAHALLMSEVWVVLWALGLPFVPLDPLMVEGGAKLVGIVFFFVPGQVGASEGVYVALLRAIGLPAAAGLTLALVRRVRGLLVAGGGLLVLGWLGDR